MTMPVLGNERVVLPGHANRVSDNNPEREKKYLRLEQPLPFDSTAQAKVTTLLEISKKISSFFKSVFKDVDGVYIQPDPSTGRLTCFLYMSAKGNGNCEVIGAGAVGKNAPLGERIASQKTQLGGRQLRLSDEAKELLEPYIEIPQGYKNVNWDQITADKVATEGFNNTRLYLEVRNISVERVIKTLFGAKDEEGNRYEYSIEIRRALSVMQQPGFVNYIVSILRVEREAVDELLKQAGFMPSAGSIPMI